MSLWTNVAGGYTIGYDEDGSGPPLVLVHAFPLCRVMWRPQLSALATKYRVILPDVFGFGESTLPAEPWTIDSMADALAAFLSDIGVSAPIVLGGLSMGGYIAMAFARRHPDRLRALILADTRAEADSAEAKANRDKTMALAREQGSIAVFDQLLPKMLTDASRADRPGMVEAVREVAGSQPVEGVVAALQALRDRPDAGEGLRQVRVPTLVLTGAEDPITPPEAAETIAGLVAGSRLALLPAAAHLANLEAQEAFNRVVTNFLAALDRPKAATVATAGGPRELATLGGGCFWCVEAAFEQLRGVHSVVSGYSGGHVPDPTYEQVCGKRTGHAEVVQVTFDPTVLSFRDLLGVFFAIHDPTTPNRQGSDVGPQYRSAIFYHSEEQRAAANDVISDLSAAEIWPGPVVTELSPFKAFYPAEDYHQGYYRANPAQPYCAVVVTPKVAKFRKQFAGLLK